MSGRVQYRHHPSLLVDYALSPDKKPRTMSQLECNRTWHKIKEKTYSSSEALFQDFINKMASRLFFHGTSATSASSIRKHGMRLKKKKGGCTAKMTQKTGVEFDAASKEYHYLTPDLAIACQYAKSHPQASVIPIILPIPKFGSSISADPEEPEGIRVQKTISSKYILGENKFNRHLYSHIEQIEGAPVGDRDFIEFQKRVAEFSNATS